MALVSLLEGFLGIENKSSTIICSSSSKTRFGMDSERLGIALRILELDLFCIWLPYEVIKRIVSIPPHHVGGEDRVIWSR